MVCAGCQEAGVRRLPADSDLDLADRSHGVDHFLAPGRHLRSEIVKRSADRAEEVAQQRVVWEPGPVGDDVAPVVRHLAGVRPVDERPHCGGGVVAIAPATCGSPCATTTLGLAGVALPPAACPRIAIILALAPIKRGECVRECCGAGILTVASQGLRGQRQTKRQGEAQHGTLKFQGQSVKIEP